MKRILTVFIAGLLALTLNLCASAEMTDNAAMLTQSQAEALDARAKQLTKDYGILVSIHTEFTDDDYSSASSSAYNRLNDKLLDYDSEYIDSGIIFYIDMTDRYWYIDTRGDAEFIFNSAAVDEIEQAAENYLPDGEYYEAFDAYLDVAHDVLEANANGEEYEVPAELSSLFVFLGIAAVVSFIIALIWVSVLKSKLTSVKFKHGAVDYEKAGSLNITDRRDIFLYKNVSCVPRPKSNSSSGGRSGGGGGSRGGRF